MYMSRLTLEVLNNDGSEVTDKIVNKLIDQTSNLTHEQAMHHHHLVKAAIGSTFGEVVADAVGDQLFHVVGLRGLGDVLKAKNATSD